MKQFKDSKDRAWDITFNVNQAKRVKDVLKVDLTSLYQDEAQRLFTNPCLLVDVLYVLCQKQCEERKVTDIEFGESMVGDALENAANALLLEVADFFPSSRKAIYLAMLEKSKAVSLALTEKTMIVLNSLDPMSLVSATTSQDS